jgi:hypothetical protein
MYRVGRGGRKGFGEMNGSGLFGGQRVVSTFSIFKWNADQTLPGSIVIF